MHHSAVDVSVVVPFRDHEDGIGRACRRLAMYLREANIPFEIIAIDAGSGDNSQLVLNLLRKEISELRVEFGSRPDRAIAQACDLARGKTLAIVTPEVAHSRPLPPLARAIRRTAHSELDLAVVEGRFAVCRRSRCLSLLRGVRGHVSERQLARRGRKKGLRVESVSLGGQLRESTPLLRILASLIPHSVNVARR